MNRELDNLSSIYFYGYVCILEMISGFILASSLLILSKNHAKSGMMGNVMITPRRYKAQ